MLCSHRLRKRDHARYTTPRWQSPLALVPEMIGHSGAFGNVLYHLLERDRHIAGTVNLLHPRSLLCPFPLRLADRLR